MKNIKVETIKVIISTCTKENSGQCRINIFILYEEVFISTHLIILGLTNGPLC